MEIIWAENAHIRKMLRRHHWSAAEVEGAFGKRVAELEASRADKIKTAGCLHYGAEVLWEIRLKLHGKDYRVAYTRAGAVYQIVYLSETLLKKAFVKELSSLEQVHA